MNIVKPSGTIVPHNITKYRFIEKIGRTCYKSEDKITEGSDEKFVGNLMKRKHLAMIEHETIYIKVPKGFMEDFLFDMKDNQEQLRYFNITNRYDKNDCCIISGSFRAFYDLFVRMGDFKYSTINSTSPLAFLLNLLREEYPLIFGEFTEYPTNTVIEPYYTPLFKLLSREEVVEDIRKNVDKDYVDKEISKHLTHTVLFVCDRGVTHEFVRHRPCSFAQESTRYCNYSLGKFDNSVTFIEPFFFASKENHSQYVKWLQAMNRAEEIYFELLENGATPQEARSVLPNSLKTELVITATEQEWQHIINLRYNGTTGAPHPQIKEVMGLVVEDLVKESDGRLSYETDKETN